MRIKFTKQLAVKLEDVPVRAWGRIQIVHDSRPPSVDTAGQFAESPSGPPTHCFPAGAVVELPDEMAAPLVTAGVAEVYVGATGNENLETRFPEIHNGKTAIEETDDDGEA